MSNPFDIEDLRKAERTIRFCRFRFANDKATLTRTEIFNAKEEAAEIMDQAQGMLRMCMDALGESEIDKAIDQLVEEREGQKLVCVKPGRIEVVVGEAHSAEVKEGDIFTIQREINFRYFGTLNIQGSMFKHDPGLSGKRVGPGLRSSEGLECSVLKQNVDTVPDENDFWAEWEFVKGE